tara:strand:- start:608 stop:850 length:243 start_codon:yes stop_codon:yes gene_type:complete
MNKHKMELESAHTIYEKRKEDYNDVIYQLVQNTKSNKVGGQTFFKRIKNKARKLTKNDEDASHFIACIVYDKLLMLDNSG